LKITVYFNIKDVKPTVIQNATVVLADVLRATTIIPVFMYHGAEAVVLCPDPGAAKKAFEKLKRGEGILAGERDWDKIPGFPLGGSPLGSSRDKVKGRIVCFTTPSPLRVLKTAKRLLLGSFVNLGDVYESCLRAKLDVVIVCAGAVEDWAFAGMLVDFLQNTLGSVPIVLAESANEAVARYKPWQGRLVDLLRDCPEGKELTRKGYGKDLDYSAKLNRVSAVPYLKGDLFLKEDTPKPKKLAEDGKPRITSAPKGKSIKVTVPLFPKNPEHPVPGMEKAAAHKAAAALEEKKRAEEKHAAAKHAAGKHPEAKPADAKRAGALKQPEAKHGDTKRVGIVLDKKKGAKGEAAKKPEKVVKPKGPPKPMFSKKTVAAPVVKKVK
jgi:2-phosphosulfolactate phosphatase